MRPITKNDVKRWRQIWSNQLRVTKHDNLGIIVNVGYYWAYAVGPFGETPKWVRKRELEKRKKLGFPQKRKMKPRQMLQDGLFSLDEIALGEELIRG